jgi:hypothetical protein
VTALVVSCQLIFGGFFLSILGIKQTRRTPIGAKAKLPAEEAERAGHAG